MCTTYRQCCEFGKFSSFKSIDGCMYLNLHNEEMPCYLSWFLVALNQKVGILAVLEQAVIEKWVADSRT